MPATGAPHTLPQSSPNTYYDQGSYGNSVPISQLDTAGSSSTLTLERDENGHTMPPIYGEEDAYATYHAGSSGHSGSAHYRNKGSSKKIFSMTYVGAGDTLPGKGKEKVDYENAPSYDAASTSKPAGKDADDVALQVDSAANGDTSGRDCDTADEVDEPSYSFFADTAATVAGGVRPFMYEVNANAFRMHSYMGTDAGEDGAYAIPGRGGRNKKNELHGYQDDYLCLVLQSSIDSTILKEVEQRSPQAAAIVVASSQTRAGSYAASVQPVEKVRLQALYGCNRCLRDCMFLNQICRAFSMRVSTWHLVILFIICLEMGNMYVSKLHLNRTDVATHTPDEKRILGMAQGKGLQSSTRLTICSALAADLELNSTSSTGSAYDGDGGDDGNSLKSIFPKLFSKSKDYATVSSEDLDKLMNTHQEKAVSVTTEQKLYIHAMPPLMNLEDEIGCEYHHIGDPAKGQWTQVKMKLCTLKCQLETCDADQINQNEISNEVIDSNYYLRSETKMQMSEVYLHELRPNHRDSVVLDIGCNVGWFSQIAVMLGYRVYGIDAQPLCAQEALTSAIKNGKGSYLKAYAVGISTVRGETSQAQDSCKAHLESKENIKDPIQVPLLRLDTFVETVIGMLRHCSPGNQTDIRMLHVSVEGSEIDVLKSGITLKSRWPSGGRLQREHVVLMYRVFTAGLALLSSQRVHSLLLDVSPLYWTSSLDFVPSYQAAMAIDVSSTVAKVDLGSALTVHSI
eukprot:scaffold412_cov388-Prasinococcus_capsulatus_cf.AAC.40